MRPQLKQISNKIFLSITYQKNEMVNLYALDWYNEEKKIVSEVGHVVSAILINSYWPQKWQLFFDTLSDTTF